MFFSLILVPGRKKALAGPVAAWRNCPELSYLLEPPSSVEPARRSPLDHVAERHRGGTKSRREATNDGSRHSKHRSGRFSLPVRDSSGRSLLLPILAAAGAVMLLSSAFATVISVDVASGSCEQLSDTGPRWRTAACRPASSATASCSPCSRLAVVLMAVGAWRGSRPAAAALVAFGAAGRGHHRPERPARLERHRSDRPRLRRRLRRARRRPVAGADRRRADDPGRRGWAVGARPLAQAPRRAPDRGRARLLGPGRPHAPHAADRGQPPGAA